MDTEQTRIYRIVIEDRTSDDPYAQQSTTITLGSSFKGDEVTGIEVEYPADRAPLVKLVHYDTVTVLPDVRIMYYQAALKP